VSLNVGPAGSGLPYHLVLLGGARSRWWALLGVPVLAIGMYLLAPAVWLIPFMAWFLADGRDLRASTEQLVDIGDPTPATLAYILLTLATAIPISWFLISVIHGLRPRWLSSVVPRLRWGFLLACFGLSFVALLLTLVLSAVMPGQAEGQEISGSPNAFTDTVRDFALVIVLLTPLQAAGEEYAFRGYLTQAFGRVFHCRFPAVPAIAAVVGPALLFALAHGAGQSFPIFFDRLAFGLVAGVLVIATGGLEAGIAFHVLNNWLAFGLAVAFFDMGSALNPTGGSWWDVPVTVVKSLVYLGLALVVARRMGLATTTDPAILEGSGGRV
jgi:membrane protease YdiL (CAAX protease family)